MGSPQLDYYIGQRIEKVMQEGEAFTLVLESGVQITNEKDGALPPGIDGFEFFSIGAEDEEQIELYVGKREGEGQHATTTVILSPPDYRIADEAFSGGPHYPHRNIPEDEIEQARPADPSAERDKGAKDSERD